MFSHYAATLLYICVAAFEVVTIQETGQKVVAALNSIIAACALAIYSYGGQIVLDSSISMCNELYEIDKNNIFVIAMSQRSVKLTVGFFNPNMLTCRLFLVYTMRLISLFRYLAKFYNIKQSATS